MLSDGKSKIKSAVDKFNEKAKDPEKLNIYEQMIEGRTDFSQILTQATENFAKRKLSKVKDIHELSQAIVLTTMARKADEFEVELEKLGQNTVVGENLVEYFRKDHCIYLTKTMFKYLNLVTDSFNE